MSVTKMYVTDDDRDTIVWVQDHGGIEGLSRLFQDADNRRVELCAALGIDLDKGWSEAMAAMRLRLMPEGYEWPTVDGRKVDFKTSYQPSLGVLEAVSIYNNGACEVMSHDGIIKPVSEIHVVATAADGEPLEAGQTVWHVVTGREYTVRSCTNGGAHLSRGGKPAGYCRAEYLTHQRPVLGADGVPIETCQKMWRVRNGEEVRVSQIDRGEHPIITYIGEDGLTHEITPDGLTHTKPEPPKRFCRDCAHWQKDPTADKMGVCWFFYHEYEGQDCYSARLSDIGACEEFMPSARALAERERDKS